MAEEIIEVTIDAAGELSMKPRGFTGTECLDATAPLVRMTGGDVIRQEMTGEAYQQTYESDPERLHW